MLKGKCTLFLLLAFKLCIADAAIYMQQEANGNITYSDMPLANGTQIEVPPANTTQALQASATVTTETVTAPTAIPLGARVEYKNFFIRTPKPQETFQNQPIIPVVLGVEPALQKGDKIQLFLDGKPYGEAADVTELGLSQVERGQHQVSAAIIDNNQRVLKQTEAITIYVHKTSIQNPPAAANTTPSSSQQSRNLIQVLFRLLV